MKKLLLLLLPLYLFAQEAYELKAVKINGSIKIDGKLDESFWASAGKIELKYEVQITDNTPAVQKTYAMALYNSEFLYFGFICHDTDPSKIRAKLTDRDKNFEDDLVVLLIDTYGDNQKTYEFFVNPFGIQGDGIRTLSGEDISFDAVWQSAGSINDSGWTVEIAIPFKSLRFPQRKMQEWKILVGRIYPREARYIFSWTPIDKNNPCLMCQAGKLTGLHDISSPMFFEILPYAMLFKTDALKDFSKPSSGLSNNAPRGRAGGGVKFSPNPELTLETVINPDFSQVESDAYQISVNTTFALYYPEKRPFFFEGSEMFGTRVNVFYSRMINNPLFAFKAIQKSGNFSLGFLSALDRNSVFIIPGEERSSSVATGLKSFANILRTRYDFGNESFIGAIATSRNLTSSYNYVGGFDWNFRIKTSYSFAGQIVYSLTKELNDPSVFSSSRIFGNTTYTAGFNGERYFGSAVNLRISRETKHHSLSIIFRDFSPTFQPHLGFVTSNGVRILLFDNNFTFYPQNSFINIAYIFTNGGIKFNYFGMRKEMWTSLGIGAQLKTQTQVSIALVPLNEEIFSGRHFRKIYRLFANIYSTPTEFFSGSLSGEFGRFIFRTSEPKLGIGHDLNVWVKLSPTDKIQISLSYSRAGLRDIETRELFYDGYVTSLIFVYQFNPQMFARLIGQYDSFSGSVQVFPLLSFKLNPFTIFYIGSDVGMLNYEGEMGIKQVKRDVFLKVQYLFRN